MATTTHPASTRGSTRVRVQQFGTFLSNMIMPNIGAIIAWGLITAFFIPDGWTPNEKIATMVGPTITYLLPILIAYTGGRLVYDVRGGVVGATSVMGVILATSDPIFIGDGNGSPMFLGAMIMGPLSALIIEAARRAVGAPDQPGFEMLVNNFSAGILAGLLAIAGMFLLAPVLRRITEWFGDAVNFLVDNSLLPLTSIVIEPAKVLFLNNAINHGVLTPLGIQEAAEQGKSVLFLLEANPGPGLGLLMAYTFFGRGIARASGAGRGDHPVLRRHPRDLLPVRADEAEDDPRHHRRRHDGHLPVRPLRRGAAGSGRAGLDRRGLRPDAQRRLPRASRSGSSVPRPSPSSVGAVLLRTDRSPEDGDLAGATADMEAMKGKRSGGLLGARRRPGGDRARSTRSSSPATPSMGSSAMGASVLRKKIHAAGFPEVTVVNKAIASLGDDYDLVVTHQDLTARAQQRTGLGHPRLGGQLHGESALRRDRRAGAAAQRRGRRHRGRGAGRHDRPRRTAGAGLRSCSTPRARPARAAITRAGEPAGRGGGRGGVVRRRDARPRAVGLDLHGQRPGDPRTAPTRRRPPYAARPSRSCATPSRSSGRTSRCGSSWASRPSATTTSGSWGGSRRSSSTRSRWPAWSRRPPRTR